MNGRLIMDMCQGIISELELCGVQAELNADICLKHAERAKKAINELEYEIWSSIYTSGIPYGKQATESWK